MAVNGVLAWLAFDGPRKQREADRALLQQTLAHEAAKTLNVQLGGLNVCRTIYSVADEMLSLSLNVTGESVLSLRGKRPDLAMQVRLLEYFLSKDIADSVVVHAMMKTKDAAGNLLGALDSPALQGGAIPQVFKDVERVVEHVLSQCKEERLKIQERIASGEAFIDSLTS